MGRTALHSEQKNKAVRNVVFSILNIVLTVALGIVLPRLYIVSFGSEVNGMLSSLQQLLVYMGLFEAGIGATTLQALYSLVATNNYDEINGVLSAASKYYKKTAFFYGISLIIIAFVYPIIVKSNLSYWLICKCVILSGIGSIVNYSVCAKYKVFLQADGRYYVSTNVMTVITIVSNISRIAVMMLGGNIVMVLLVSACIQVVPSFYIVFYIRRNYPLININVKPLNEKIDKKKYMLLHQIAGMIFQNTDVLILSVMCGLKIGSVYAVYRLVISYIESIVQIPVNSIGFIFGQTFHTNKKNFIDRIDLFERWYSALAFAIYVVTLSLFSPFIAIYTKGVTDINYVDSFLPILFVLVALLSVIRVPMLNTINYAGHFKETLPQSLAETAINLSVTIVGVHYIGIYGALIGTIVALLYRTTDIIIYANKRILQRSPAKTILIYLENIVVAVLAFCIVNSMPKPNNYFEFLIYGLMQLSTACVLFLVGHFVCSRKSRQLVKTYYENKIGGK